MSQPTEPQMRRYLLKVMKTVSAAMVFLLLHMTFGIFLGWGFYEVGPTIGNWVYYAILLLSTAGFVHYLMNIWELRWR